jgi:hypothetical protein
MPEPRRSRRAAHPAGKRSAIVHSGLKQQARHADLMTRADCHAVCYNQRAICYTTCPSPSVHAGRRIPRGFALPSVLSPE